MESSNVKEAESLLPEAGDKRCTRCAKRRKTSKTNFYHFLVLYFLIFILLCVIIFGRSWKAQHIYCTNTWVPVRQEADRNSAGKFGH